MTRREDNLVTWFLMFLILMGVAALGSSSMDFEEKCNNVCAPARYITPLYQFQHTCFCEESHGRWKLKEVNNQ